MSTKVVLKNVRFSYVTVLEPKGFNGSEPKYSVSILFPKTDTENIEKMRAAIKKEIDDVFGGKKPNGFQSCLRDGDAEREGDPVYAGNYFFNASSKKKPLVVDADHEHITNPDVIYSGCYGAVSVNLYGYSYNKIRHGVACGLNGLIKLQDGERLDGGGSSVLSDFGDIAKPKPKPIDEDDFL
jgi:hypothetical protein